MSKNIVLLSDGTGNSAKALFKTNVWRLFQVLDLRNPSKQVAFYDDGVGTSSFKLFAVLGGIFGIGLKRNVIAIYSFCCRNYEADDRIFCFGFSRGAFTARIVAGMIASEGLVRYHNNEADLARFAADAYRRYRRRFNGGILKQLDRVGINLRDLRDWAIRCWRRVTNQHASATIIEIERIQFVGIWDTVDAYGGPIQEMTRAIDYWVWPLSMPDHFMSAKVHRACHALALEEERDAFTPVIWDERYVRGRDGKLHEIDTDWEPDVSEEWRGKLQPIDCQRLSQVWFVGVHSDIGGGYPQNGLSYVTLDWMMNRAEPYGLLYHPGQRQSQVTPQIDPTDKLNDSRQGLASYYRYKPRNVLDIYNAPSYKLSVRADACRMWRYLRKTPDPQSEILAELYRASPSQTPSVLPVPLATIHESVFERITEGTDRYAPVVLPADYKVAGWNGSVSHVRPAIDKGRERSKVQDDVWNWVWLRRVVYFLTVFASLFVVGIPFFVIYAPGFGLDAVGSYVNPLVNAAASFLPTFLEPWFVAFRNAPGFVLIGAVAIGVLWLAGANVQVKVRDVARVTWHSPQNYPALSGWHSAVYRLRRFGAYRAGFYLLTHWILPTAIMFWFFWWLAFGTANTLGLFCKPTGQAIEVTGTDTPARESVGYSDVFKTRELCHPTGLKVTHGEKFQITLTIPDDDPWIDKDIPTNPNGFVLGSLRQIGGIPFKRLIWSNWFRPIIRVGSTGFEEHLPAFAQDSVDKKVWRGDFTARSDGEVFIYVNDTSIFLPWLWHVFYDNNRGWAAISLRKM
jgi:uncharacterized protein (DUF2235 family)